MVVVTAGQRAGASLGVAAKVEIPKFPNKVFNILIIFILLCSIGDDDVPHSPSVRPTWRLPLWMNELWLSSDSPSSTTQLHGCTGKAGAEAQTTGTKLRNKSRNFLLTYFFLLLAVRGGGNRWAVHSLYIWVCELWFCFKNLSRSPMVFQ